MNNENYISEIQANLERAGKVIEAIHRFIEKIQIIICESENE
jgi:hypothetical protein